ncbi:MAG: hypothetical protein CSB48_11740 [Proteobacteria bacterium]|nr:MAG: hypothetical protein CSB48_11740 [Pseudomonadota bacterium]
MRRNVSVVLTVFVFFFAQMVRAETRNVDMFVGEVKVLGKFDVSRIAVGNGKTVKVEIRNETEIILIAESKGSSSIRLWLKDGSERDFNVRVSGSDPETRIRMESMIRIHVKMIEVRKSALEDIGINWSSQINGPALTTAGDFISNGLFRSNSNAGLSNLPLNVKPFSTHFGMASSITSQINILASNGDATTLAEPILSCINGGTASFLAGGEVPYPVTGSNGQTSVEFKEYGIRLNINPRADNSGNIFTNILAEISQIDSAVTVLGAPGILTRRTQTQINLVTGQTIVIAGLVNAESSEDIDKVPFLGDIPILDNLFKSKTFRNQKSELVIFITPEIVKPRNIQLNKRELRIYDFADKKLEAINNDVGFHLMD